MADLITVSAGDNGKTIWVPLNDLLLITLESNPTTGYDWIFSVAPDSRILKLLKFYQEVINPNIVGSPSLEHWLYEAVGEGTTRIELVYKRPWEMTVPPEQTFSICINVSRT